MTKNARASDRILGTLGSEDGSGVVRIEDRYDTEIDDLWQAITDPARLARWYGRVEGDLREGAEFRLTIDAIGWDGSGRVHTCEPPCRLRVSTREWDESYESGVGVAPFDEGIEATLTADGHQTVLVIEVTGIPLDKVAFYGAGWQQHAEALAEHVAGRDVVADEARFEALVPPYQELAADLG